MKPFGKNEEDLTADEKKFYELNLALATGMLMEAEMLGMLAILMGIMMPAHNREIVNITVFGGTKLLGIPEPTSQEDFNVLQESLEKSDYSMGKFLDLYKADFQEFKDKREDKGNAVEEYAHGIMERLGIPTDETELVEE